MRLLDLEKLAHSQVAITAAHRAALPLQEKGWMRFPALSWNKPAIVVMDGDRCVAGLNWSEDADTMALDIEFAWCDQDAPTALAAMLVRFRKRYSGSAFTEVRFGCHEGNNAMAKAVRVLGLKPTMHSYRMPLKGE